MEKRRVKVEMVNAKKDCGREMWWECVVVGGEVGRREVVCPYLTEEEVMQKKRGETNLNGIPVGRLGMLQVGGYDSTVSR